MHIRADKEYWLLKTENFTLVCGNSNRINGQDSEDCGLFYGCLWKFITPEYLDVILPC